MAKMTLGKRLWEARLRKGFSRQSLADHLTVSAASIYLWETDRSVPAGRQPLCYLQGFGIAYQGHEGVGRSLISTPPGHRAPLQVAFEKRR